MNAHLEMADLVLSPSESEWLVNMLLPPANQAEWTVRRQERGHWQHATTMALGTGFVALSADSSGLLKKGRCHRIYGVYPGILMARGTPKSDLRA